MVWGKDLSNREREVSGLVARGFTNEEIVKTLDITKQTVKTHYSKSIQKPKKGYFSALLVIAKQTAILIKKILKQTCPPFLWSILKKTNRRYGFFGVYFDYSNVLSEGAWNNTDWTSLQKQKLSQLESSRDENLFLPRPHLSNYLVIPCLFINLLSQEKTIRVLDHGGGQVSFITISILICHSLKMLNG